MSAFSPTFPDDDTSDSGDDDSSSNIPATSGDDDPPLRPAVFSDTGVSGTPEQVATYNALNNGAGPDPTVDAGSSANPYGVRACSYVPGGASYVDFDGTTGVAQGGGYLALSGPPPSLSESIGAGAPPSLVSFQPPHTVTPAPDILPPPSSADPQVQSQPSSTSADPATPDVDAVDGYGTTVQGGANGVVVTAHPSQAEQGIVAFLSPQGPQPYLVSRTILHVGPLGIDVGKHEFVVNADKPGGQIADRWDYGPSGPWYSPGQLVELRDILGPGTAQDDTNAWNSLGPQHAGASRWLTSFNQVNASAAEVARQGAALDRYLGTPQAPGPVPYLAVPKNGIPAANSNSAAETLVNNAIQTGHPGDPFQGPAGLPSWLSGPIPQCFRARIQLQCFRVRK